MRPVIPRLERTFNCFRKIQTAVRIVVSVTSSRSLDLGRPQDRTKRALFPVRRLVYFSSGSFGRVAIGGGVEGSTDAANFADTIETGLWI
jgi:hypothetical protein